MEGLADQSLKLCIPNLALQPYQSRCCLEELQVSCEVEDVKSQMGGLGLEDPIFGCHLYCKHESYISTTSGGLYWLMSQHPKESSFLSLILQVKFQHLLF